MDELNKLDIDKKRYYLLDNARVHKSKNLIVIYKKIIWN